MEEMNDVSLVINEEGYFAYFINEEKQMYNSLQELIVEYKRFLDWEYRNSQNENVAENITIINRKGQDYQSGGEWYNTLEYNGNDKSRNAKNWAKDNGGEWSEEHANKGRERWAKKKGQRGGQEWYEEWYKKCKTLPKKRDEDGKELDEMSPTEKTSKNKIARNGVRTQTQMKSGMKNGAKYIDKTNVKNGAISGKQI